jgi:glucokinase
MAHGIGLDLGGSSAKLAIVADTGNIVAEAIVPIGAGTDPIAVLEPVATAIGELLAFHEADGQSIEALGCGFSGYLDDTGARIELNNTPALNGFALGSWLRARWSLPVAVDNDACVAAFAEVRCLHQTNKRRVLFVTVGSGIGTVLVVDGAIVRVMKGITGDSSHLIVNHGSSVRCPYGCYGCLETVASARAIARAGMMAAKDGSSTILAGALARVGEITGLDVSRAAASGDVAAQHILIRAGEWLGVGLASLACVYAPDLIILGGAVSQAGDAWLQSTEAAMRRTCTPFCGAELSVTKAALGNHAGVIGAALLAMSVSS